MKTPLIFPGLLMLLLTMLSNSGPAAQGHLNVIRVGTNYNYIVFNDEPPNSTLRFDNFRLEANAPFDVVGSPAGWSFETDNLTYVNWFSTNTTPPYQNDIPANSSKSGFTIASKLPPQLPATSENRAFIISSWNHATDTAGTAVSGFVEAPAITTVAAVFSRSTFTNGVFNSQLIGVPNSPYALYSSTNFTTWQLEGTNIAPAVLQKSNTPAFSVRFYRANFVPGASAHEPD